MTGPRKLVALSREEALRLLAGVSLGRVVFTLNALPAIRPVNHLLDDGSVIIRTHEGSALLPTARHEAVVAYEADEIDPVSRLGWSVIVTGRTSVVSDPDLVARYRDRLRPWVACDMDDVVRISTEFVTGFRLGEG